MYVDVQTTQAARQSGGKGLLFSRKLSPTQKKIARRTKGIAMSVIESLSTVSDDPLISRIRLDVKKKQTAA